MESSPLQLASAHTGNGLVSLPDSTYTASVCVGKDVLNATQKNNASVQSSPLLSGILLEVDAYTFNPIYENSYLSQNIKKIEYEDLYQFQVLMLLLVLTLIILFLTELQE